MESASAAYESEPTVESSQPTDETYRAHFASWLGGMSEEARQLAFLLEREEASAPLRRLAADSLNQLLHAADMLPEGTEALGYLETSFAFRMLAAELADAAYSAPRLPKPKPKVEPAAPQPTEPVEPTEVESLDAAGDADGAELDAQSSPYDARSLVSARAEVDAVGAELAPEELESQARAVELEAEAAEAAAADGEAAAIELPAGESGAIELPAGEPSQDELAEAESAAKLSTADGSENDSAGEGELPEGEPDATEPSAARPSEADAAAAAPPEQEWEEPEPAQASDASYALPRRLAPQAALVRAFLGTEDAERLRRLVLEQRNRPSRGRSSKAILLESDARAAAASEAREWADSYEAPEFGSAQHDLLRLRTFMRTRVRRTTS